LIHFYKRLIKCEWLTASVSFSPEFVQTGEKI